MVPEAALEKLLNNPDENAAEEFAGLYDKWRAAVKRQGFETIRARMHRRSSFKRARRRSHNDIPGIETMTVCGNKTVLMFLIAAD